MFTFTIVNNTHTHAREKRKKPALAQFSFLHFSLKKQVIGKGGEHSRLTGKKFILLFQFLLAAAARFHFLEFQSSATLFEAKLFFISIPYSLTTKYVIEHFAPFHFISLSPKGATDEMAEFLALINAFFLRIRCQNVFVLKHMKLLPFFVPVGAALCVATQRTTETNTGRF